MNKPAIAVRRRVEALNKFSYKLDKLQELLNSSSVEKVPDKMRPTTFVDWEDEELGVERFSRNALYEKNQEYTILREKMNLLLQQLAKKRAEGGKKENQIKRLRDQLEAAERKAQNYVNEYSAVRAELKERELEILRLRVQVERLREHGKKVRPLRPIKTSDIEVE